MMHTGNVLPSPFEMRHTECTVILIVSLRISQSSHLCLFLLMVLLLGFQQEGVDLLHGFVECLETDEAEEAEKPTQDGKCKILLTH